MSLYKRKNSNVWQMCFHVNGNKVRRSTKTTNKKVAQRIYEKAKIEALEGNFLTNERCNMPFDELVNEFQEKHSKVEKESYENDIYVGNRLTKYFKQTPIGKITTYDIKSWRVWRKDQTSNRGTPVSKSTLNIELSFLKTMFNLAVEWGWLSENPAQPVKRLKGEVKRMRFLNRDEIARLINSADSVLKPVVVTAISTGMRRGEILNLKWKDVDFENGFIKVEKSKNKDRRDIPIETFLRVTLESLTESREKGEFVFLVKNGPRLGVGYLDYHFQLLREKVGLDDFRFHDLRHTAASLYASGGCDIMSLKNLLGHKNIEMTQRYAHLIPNAHDRTRKIMNDFWSEQEENTKKNTPENE